MAKENLSVIPEEKHLIPVMDWVSNTHIVDQVDPKDLVQRKIIRNRIEDLADTLMQSVSDGAMASEDGSLTHYHTKGIYARELFIPKGTIMVSKLHKLPRLCIILSGDISFTLQTVMKSLRNENVDPPRLYNLG